MILILDGGKYDMETSTLISRHREHVTGGSWGTFSEASPHEVYRTQKGNYFVVCYYGSTIFYYEPIANAIGRPSSATRAITMKEALALYHRGNAKRYVKEEEAFPDIIEM